MVRRFCLAALLSVCTALVACGDAASSEDDDSEVEGTSEEALSGDQGLDYGVEDATDLGATEPPASAFSPHDPHSDDDGDEGDELAPANVAPLNHKIGKPIGGPAMTPHGGSVMPTATVYFIYYGDWSKNRRTIALHASFMRGLAANAWNRDWLGATRFYADPAKERAGKHVAYGTSIVVGAPRGPTLTNDDVGKVVYDLVSQKRLPLDPNGIYFVMTGKNVAQELEKNDCGWHTEGAMTIGAATQTIRYAWVADTRRARCSIYPKGARTPNSDYIADSQATVIAHELAETLTDPNLDGFYQGNYHEIGDKCAWYFEHVVSMKGGAQANIRDRRSGRNWLVQDLFENHACTLGAAR